MSGVRTCGDKSVLLNAVNNGASVKVLKPETGFMTSLTTVEVSSDSLDVHGQYPWRLGQIKLGEEFDFPTRVFWLLTTWSTTGTIPTSQWYVGQHISLNTFQDFGSMEWLVDDCWTQVYSHDTFGRGIYGSLDLLVESVLAGKRVRVKINSYITEADNLYVRNGQVSAQLLGQYSKNAAYEFPTDVYWVWQIASTTGDVETVRYNIGSTVNKMTSNDKESITWFVESRPWSKVLTTSSSGIATYGSKANLISSLQRGYLLRLVVYEEEDSYSIIEADNISIPSSEVAVQSVRYISDENGSGWIPRRFKSPAYWKFTLTSTNGNQQAAWWKVGEHSSLPATIEIFQVDWIVG